MKSPPPSARHVLWLEWEGFYADEGREAPTIVSREARVLDANAAARKRGIRVGMTTDEARNIVPDLVRTPWREEFYRDRQRAWLDLCVPFSSRVEAIDGHVAALDLSDHPRPHEIAETLLWSLERSSGLSLLVGSGPSKWLAALAARHPGSLRPTAEFLAPLPIELLTPIEPAQRERLVFLGYRKVGDVARLPLDALRDQFGAAGLRIYQAARGTLADPVRPNYPPDLLSVAKEFEGAVEREEALFAGVDWIAGELAERLETTGTAAKRVTLFLETEEGEHGWSRTFTKPLASAPDLRGALSRMLTPLPRAKIVGLRVALSELGRARRVQLDTEDRRAKSDAEESVRVALQHARTVFGQTSVRLGSELAIPRWAKVRRAYRDATGWAWI